MVEGEFADGYLDLKNVCEQSILQRTDFEAKAQLVDQALSYFDHLQLEIKTLDL